jgi:osmotically-inducible protein OsmY
MSRHHQDRQKGHPEDSSYNRGYDDPMHDQRNSDPALGNRPRHWQGQSSGEQGRWQGGPDFDRRGYGRGQQFGRAGEYGRAYEESGRQGFEGNYDRGDDDFGRGNERVRDERGRGWDSPGVRRTGPGESVSSRSADPGQSSYGGFSNEDPRFQRQQFERYAGGRGYGGEHHSAQGGQQQGWRAERQQHVWPSGQERSGGPRIMPKGYTRSDERLMEDICEQLGHSGIDVSEVSVEVSGGRVKLEGTVKDRRSKHAIEDIADDCSGVTDVDNRIRVQRDADTGAGEMSIGEGS